MEKEKELYKGLQPFLNCKDYTVSGETYEVMLNQKYEMLVTSPVPVDLENYYKSENYISHTDSKKTLFEKIYQTVKKYTLKRKLQLINSFETSNKNILDVGAGTGDFLKVCKNNNWNTIGVEPSIDAINIAAQKGIFLKESLYEIENQKFDVITLWHVLEHVGNLNEYISSLKELLSKDGRIIVAVPNYKSYDANYYKEFWAAFDVPRHLWHFSQNSIHKLFSEKEMRVEKTLPMKFDSYYVSLLSEKYKSGKNNPFNGFYRGFLSNIKARSTTQYSSLIYVIKNN
ncbi:class I SAM-dependent methyltransferase [Polaribacter sp. MSW13]|uniref:Class I SAM-dependent methyltransferase n=1 Tax=Polaribacter marinus TaxID=2916838 RepID=A0A9X2AN13_9FLAO|nr:class I SAM-dependent methyltransferase [Polaribacter marinus]MCI2229439.1 class I SAM-dependent methyltransferase [Polaribacter marinus]